MRQIADAAALQASATPGLCACGAAIHHASPEVAATIDEAVALHGPDVLISDRGQTYRVQRHYLAAHGLVAGTLARLGFPREVAAGPPPVTSPSSSSGGKPEPVAAIKPAPSDDGLFTPHTEVAPMTPTPISDPGK